MRGNRARREWSTALSVRHHKEANALFDSAASTGGTHPSLWCAVKRADNREPPSFTGPANGWRAPSRLAQPDQEF